MSGITLNAELASVRPSRLVAEALVDGHDREQVERRAQALGISPDMADVVAAVCCRYSGNETDAVPERCCKEESSRSS